MKKLKWENAELLYTNEDGIWKHYTAHPLYNKVGDYNIPRGSKGYKLAQLLLAQGYSYITIAK